MRVALASTSLVFAVAAGACGGKKPDAPDTAAPTTAPPAADAGTAPAGDAAATAAGDAAAPGGDGGTQTPTPDCLVPEVQAALGSVDPDFARLVGRKVELCGAAGDDRLCVTLDLDSGKRTHDKLPEGDVAHLPPFPVGFDDGLVKDDARPVLKLCPASETRCKDLHVGNVLAAHFDAAKARVVVTALEEKKLTAHVYDAATQTETSTLAIGETDLPDCSFAAFAGEALLVSAGACSGGGKSWLADAKTGTKIADVGQSASAEGSPPPAGLRSTAFVRDGQLAQVEGTVWALRDASGKTVWLQDTATGEVKATIDLEKATDGTRAKHDQAFVLATPSEVVLVEARPLVGTVFVASRDGAITKSFVPRPCQ